MASSSSQQPVIGAENIEANVPLPNVYTKNEQIIIRISLPSDTPNEINFTLKFGNTFEIIMKEYTARVGIDINSVRFMYGERRIKAIDTMNCTGITQDAVIKVYKEYEYISLKLIESADPSKEVELIMKYTDSFAKIKEEYCKLVGIDPNFIDLEHQKCELLDTQSPKNLEVTDSEVVLVFKMIFVKFIKPEESCNTITVHARRYNSLENTLKKYAKLAGIDFDTVAFFYTGKPIRKETPAELNMERDVVVEVVQKSTIIITFVAADDISNDVSFRLKIHTRLQKAIEKYRQHTGEDIETLKFIFNGKEIMGNDTHRSMRIMNNDIIKVQPVIESIHVKFIDDFYSKEVHIGIKNNQLQQSMLKYAAHIGREIETLRFLFNGKRIMEYDTPGKLKMKENDSIEVLPEIEKTNVKCCLNDFELDFCIKFTSPLSELKQDFANQVGIHVESLTFEFDETEINDNDTPKSLDMDENIVIDVYEVELAE